MTGCGKAARPEASLLHGEGAEAGFEKMAGQFSANRIHRKHTDRENRVIRR